MNTGVRGTFLNTRRDVQSPPLNGSTGSARGRIRCGPASAQRQEKIHLPVNALRAGGGQCGLRICQRGLGRKHVEKINPAETVELLCLPGRSEEHTSELQSQSNLV